MLPDRDWCEPHNLDCGVAYLNAKRLAAALT
jgi:hypothetical protein